MNEIVIGGTFNYEISNKAYEIIELVKSHTDFKIDFDYTDEETPYCKKIENKYVIHIRKDTDDIEDVILHELMHVVQSENGMTKTEIPNDISDRDYELLSDLVNILLDYDANQQLSYKYNYNIASSHLQFNEWYPLIRKVKEIPEKDIKSIAVALFGIMILDSKNNCEKILLYTDKCTLEIRKIVYHLNDCFKLYDVGNNVSSCKTIYEASVKFLGIF